ncbi:MAG: family 20 glycosylhydrolase [Acidimicrobiia bacterium]|nr:family 20 glycosylhydrolase [Acidimicrobiia bacterium]
MEDGSRNRIIPVPAAVMQGSGAFGLQSAVLSVSEAALLPHAERFRGDLATYAGLELPSPTVEPDASGGSVRLELGAVERTARRTRGVRADGASPDTEVHRIVIDEAGVTVRGASEEAIGRGLTSLVQLAALGGGVVPCGTIDDAPELAWRGLSLDVVRRFLPVDEVKRVIDVLALHKLNVLHLHLTDNEGWRLHIDAWPRLTEVGATGAAAGRPGGFYTHDDFTELVEYASERFVTIVPEIDMPGHVAAALTAYPQLGVSRPSSAGSLLPVAYLDPNVEETWRFVEDVLREVAAISPAPYLHLGGDETFGMDHDDYVAFVDRAIPIVKGLGKRVVGWQEMCRAGVGPDEVIQYWIDFASLTGGDEAGPADAIPSEVRDQLAAHFGEAFSDLARIAEKRSRLLLSPTSTFYLDHPHGDPSTDPAQEERRSRLGLQFYPARSLEAMADWDLSSAIGDVDPDAVAGIEAALWCETVETSDDLQLLLLPRIAGVAELAWNPSRRPAWSDHRTRLAEHSSMWHRAGWSWFRAASVDWP